MKRIIIKESQKKRLFEAYQEGFSLKVLSSLGDNGWVDQYDYCVKWLGEPDGFGSSRCVFTISDNLILKLAMGDQRNAGIAQNKAECELFKEFNTPLLVRIFNADENFTYMVSESVVPAKEEDFEKILGLPFWHTHFQNAQKELDQTSNNNGDVEIGYNKYFDNIKKPYEQSEISLYDVLCYIETNYVLDETSYNVKFENIIRNSSWLSEFSKFVEDSGMSDFCQVENFGIVNRDGKPRLVILDSGLNLDVWKKYYAD